MSRYVAIYIIVVAGAVVGGIMVATIQEICTIIFYSIKERSIRKIKQEYKQEKGE